MLNRLEAGHDGKTPYERSNGKKTTAIRFEFGEKVMWQLRPSGRMQKIIPQWKHGAFIGVKSESGELYIANVQDKKICLARTARRVPEEERWQVGQLEWVQLVPCNLGREDKHAYGDVLEFDFKFLAMCSRASSAGFSTKLSWKRCPVLRIRFPIQKCQEVSAWRCDILYISETLLLLMLVLEVGREAFEMVSRSQRQMNRIDSAPLDRPMTPPISGLAASPSNDAKGCGGNIDFRQRPTSSRAMEILIGGWG